MEEGSGDNRGEIVMDGVANVVKAIEDGAEGRVAVNEGA